MDPRLMIGPRGPQLTGFQPQKQAKTGETRQNLTSFDALFHQAIKVPEGDRIRISAHAQKRLDERHITLDTKLENSLKEAFSELEAKGAKDSLVLTRQGAFVVNVPSRTLVTAMGIEEMRDGIVTNIDSVNMKYG